MLYIVGTSIGNIEDTSLRAVKTLTAADVILVEDTASFDSYYRRICGLFNLPLKEKQQIIHYHERNEFAKLPEVLKWLEEGKEVCLASESGLPTISDPGSILVNYLTIRNIPYTVIPGPTAFTTAIVLSGFPTKQILFLGFLPKKKSEIVHLMRDIIKNRSKHTKPTVVFYESPHRINKTLTILSEIMPEANIAICREMTKKFEEVLRGRVKDLAEKSYKGELTVVLSTD